MDPEQMMPQPSQFIPPPTSPPEASPEVGGVGPIEQMQQDPMAGQYVGPEHIKQLDELMGRVEGKIGEYTSSKFVADNTLNATKQKLLGEVLLSMQKAGINVSDQEEVAAYLEKLREFNPDIADLLESFLEKLIGSEFESEVGGEEGFQKLPGVSEDQLPAPMPAEAPQNKYENLSKTVRERI